MLARKAQRAPSVRLRFGRSDPSLRDNEVNIYKLINTTTVGISLVFFVRRLN